MTEEMRNYLRVESLAALARIEGGNVQEENLLEDSVPIWNSLTAEERAQLRDRKNVNSDFELITRNINTLAT